MSGNMDDKGWVSLHRVIQSHWLWDDKPFSRGQAWMDLVMMANHKESRFVLGNELIKVDRGEFITSELKLMKKWGWGKTKTRAFLKLLSEDGMIEKQTDQKKTTIKIVKYSLYQVSETTEKPQTDYEQTAEFGVFPKNVEIPDRKPDNKQTVSNIDSSMGYSVLETTETPQTDYEQTASKPRADTNNKLNNVNKDIKNKFGEFSNVRLNESEHIKLNDQYGDKVTKEFIDKLDTYIESTGKKYKSHYATILNWIRKEPGIRKGDHKKPTMTIDI